MAAGANGSHIVTLIERQSRFVRLRRLPSNESATVVDVLARCVRRLPDGLMKSLTWDRGTELAADRAFTVATDLSTLTQRQLDAIALQLNTRPRLTLGFQTSARKLAEIVAATG